MHIRRILGILIGLCIYFAVLDFSARFLGKRPLLIEAMTAVPGVVLFFLIRSKIDRTGQDRKVFFSNLPKTLLVVSPFWFLMANWIGQPLTEVPSTSVLLNAVIFCLLTGIGEELMFRGYLFHICEEWSRWTALLVTSLIFGLFHANQGWEIFGYALIVGLSYGAARIAGVPLWVLILFHALNNLPNNLPHRDTFSSERVVIGIAFTTVFTVAFIVGRQHWSNKTSHPSPDRSESK